MFWTIFLAVFCALYAMHMIKAYEAARERNRDYCHKKALRYTWMARIKIANERDARDIELDNQQAIWWEKRAKSLVPTSPTQDEQDSLIEQSNNDEIRQLIKDFNFHSNRKAREKNK